MPSDDYRLEIQAIDDDHRMISPSAYFDFRIPPPWWLTWWACLLELLLLVLIVALSWRWRSRRLLRQNRRLETMVAARTVELTEEKHELELARAELYHQATHDSLTGLHNRRAILDQLAAQLEPGVRAGPGLAVGLIDADHFKRINDTLGHQAGDAALQAGRLRLRPIVMTSLAFIFGVLPLAVSTGAGAQSRIAIGTAVIGGMITGTVLAVLFVPLFFVLVRRLWRKSLTPAAAQVAG